MRRTFGIVVACGVAFQACGPAGDGTAVVAPPSAEFSQDALMEHIEILSSDEFGGRAPGSAGETLTVEYLTEAFQAAGLAPGNPDGTYVQQVPLVGITATDQSHLSLVHNGREEELAAGPGYIAWTKRVIEEVSLDGELVFVGYGTVAPEYDWDDYKDLDVEGKVLVMLVNDPPGDDIFGGDAMTYYGRWTYKYEMAAEKGAAGAFIVHETVPAGYSLGSRDRKLDGRSSSTSRRKT